MKARRPTRKEISEALSRLRALLSQLEAEGSHFRAGTVRTAIDLIERLAPQKGDGHA